ncbi:MAG: aromatic amino acid transport family protein [Candidatus Ornithospirochaeta sp.]
MKKIETESSLTFFEAASIIVGHGVGSGVLAVPYLVSRNSWTSFLLIAAAVYAVNLILHFMIAELSLNNGGAQFITIFENELFKGKAGKFLSWGAFGIMGFSVLVNIAGFISGGSAVFSSWLGLPPIVSSLLYYVLVSSVVFFGMKAVGVCEKISVFSMLGVVGILFAAVMMGEKNPLPSSFVATSNVVALYSMVAFALSAVMSVPQVVKGLGGDAKKTKGAIALGTAVNMALVLVIAFITLLGSGSSITTDGALVDLSRSLGGWVSVVGYLFSLLALSTSFWANTLNLRDIIGEKTGWNRRVSFAASSLPCLLLAVSGLQGFVGFTRIAGVVQVLTGIGVIIAYHGSRKRAGDSPICGFWGNTVFQIIVIIGSVASTLGSLLKVV